MHLLTPIYSYMQPGRCYGQAGDEVTVIAVHHQVAIVEGSDKSRFAVPVENLSERPVAKSATQMSDTTKVQRRVIKTKKIIQPQNSLF